MYPKNSTGGGGTLATPPSNMEIGVYNTIPDTTPGAPTTSNTKIIEFSKEYKPPPGFIVGLNFLDFDNSHSLRIKPAIHAVISKQAVVSLSSWNNTVQYNSGLSWFLYPSDDTNFKKGSWSTKDPRAQKEITFDKEYPELPTIVVFFSTLALDKSAHTRVAVFPTDITTKGFKINVETWSEIKLEEVGVTWLALPTMRPGLMAGTFSTLDVRPAEPAQLNTQGVAEFTKPFPKGAKVFLGLNYIDVDKSAHTRIRLSTSNVTERQMDWHIDSWGDTTLRAAGAAYIVIDG
ncbi:hypothetical protein TWF694_005405 [Orbilia ellipsospora]|uniref:H-type lectin domain-containing protein n=1 Tax=Orbilia ellipsospora TaxID=2528407 RepID=A0AAV9WV58_9PEZI